MTIFMKIWEEKICPLFKTFLINWDKNEDVNENNWENDFDFLILHIKIRLCGSFPKNLKKTFLANQGKNEDGDKK